MLYFSLYYNVVSRVFPLNCNPRMRKRQQCGAPWAFEGALVAIGPEKRLPLGQDYFIPDSCPVTAPPVIGM